MLKFRIRQAGVWTEAKKRETHYQTQHPERSGNPEAPGGPRRLLEAPGGPQRPRKEKAPKRPGKHLRPDPDQSQAEKGGSGNLGR